MVDKLFAISTIVFVVVVNYLILSSKNLFVLLPIFLVTYGTSRYLLGRVFLKRLSFFLSLFIVLVSFQTIFNSSKNISESVVASLTTVLQIATISEMMNIITKKISLSRFINGLFFLPQTAKLLVTLTFSYIPFLFEEQQKISIVQKSRGTGRNLVSKFAGSFSTIVPLIHRVLQRSENLALAINMRGYEKRNSG